MKTIYQSDSCTITNYLCECTDCTLSKPEYQANFSFCFIRRGNFLFKVFRNQLDSYTGKILLNKPGYEYRVAHIHTIPDQCTIFTFSQQYYARLVELYGHRFNGFLKNRDVQSILISSNPLLDYLHYSLFSLLSQKTFNSIQIDCLLFEFVDRVFSITWSERELQQHLLKQGRRYLPNVERAKEYMQNNFGDNISIASLADECAMSRFHFARIFKSLTHQSPYQYLLSFRLRHSERLLRNSSMSVTDISHECGFNSAAHFSYAFSYKNGVAPSEYRVNGSIEDTT